MGKRKTMEDFDFETCTRRVKTRPRTKHRRYDKITCLVNDAKNINFGLQVAKSILQTSLTTDDEDKKRSMVCSLLSIIAVVNILAAGATGGMLRQLLGLLECDDVEEVKAASTRFMEVLKGSDDEDAPDICFANALWVAQRFDVKAPFLEVLRDVHKAVVRSVDFENQAEQVVKEANLWAEEQTKGLIKHVLSKESISKETMMILANALYFKEVWVHTFKRKYTKDKDFYLLNGDKIRVPCMTQLYRRKFDYGTFEKCKVLRMMYREGEAAEGNEKSKSFSMYIFLPDDKDGLPNLLENIKMDSDMFKDQIKLDSDVEIDELSIPKFSFDCNLSLKEPMKKLGLTLPFSGTCKELSEMVESPNGGDWPYVTDVLQKSQIEISEKGTKAASFTMSTCSPGYSPPETSPPPIYFVADHPFMFMIREDFSGAVLFVGTMIDPR